MTTSHLGPSRLDMLERLRRSDLTHFAYGMAAIVLMVLLLLQAASAAQTLSVSVPGKTIELSQGEWAKLEDPTDFAKNFEERKKAPWHEVGRIVTVYLTPMSEDRRAGLKISESEYVEFFIVHPGFVTVQTRVDKGSDVAILFRTHGHKSNHDP